MRTQASVGRAEPLSKRRLRAWLRLLAVTRAAEGELREFLRTEHGTTLPRFDVLAALHRGDAAMTMSELSRLLLVSNGNATAVVDRLETDGLVTRSPCENDRRSVRVALTPAGRDLFERLAVGHEEKLDAILSELTDADVDALTDILKRIGRTR